MLAPRGNILVSRVEDFIISPVDGMWDGDLIREVFWPVDVHRILQIPLTPGSEDFIGWYNTKTGLFTVKSAYYTQWEHSFGRNPQHTNAARGSVNPVWDKL